MISCTFRCALMDFLYQPTIHTLESWIVVTLKCVYDG